MKVILNSLTSFEGKSLKVGAEADIPLNIAMRWINKGLAHPVEKGAVREVKEEVNKVFDNEFYGLDKEEEPDESIIFRESETVENDTDFEPLPEVTKENKDEIKTYKPKRKRAKKINEDNS